MLDPDGLKVWNNHRLVGYLWRNAQGVIGFHYEDEWLGNSGFPVSHTLPLQSEDFSPEEGLAHRFFANLLPEGSVRDQIVRDLKIANTDFDLLRAIGGECAGAFSILLPEYLPSNYLPLQQSNSQLSKEHSKKQQYYKISAEELANLVARQGQLYTWKANERPRLSLAGAQNKCPLLVENDTYWLPKKEAPSSHILKFELSGYHHLPAYETFTTLLAKCVGLPVVNIQLCSIQDTYYALIERYDRQKVESDRIARLHQEDFCQALGFGHERKYQEDGGPTFADCYRLVQELSSDPANDLQHLLRWQIFNVLAGNSDGHAKNLSLLYHSNGEIHLAPFYDLVCTHAIDRIDSHLAFSVGDQRNPAIVSWKHWETLAQQCDLRPKFLRGQVQGLATKLLEQLQPAKEIFTDLYGEYAALQRIEQVVTKQCRRTINK